MKTRMKSVLAAMMALAAIFLVTGCGAEENPYEVNDAENYSVSVKYDANGGVFTTNTSVIVDSYNVAEMDTNSGGMAEIALISPDNECRGNDAFAAVNNGYFLAGWYAERTEGTDSNGETTYTYSGKWDFEKDLLEVDPSKTYSASEPVMTLYAAWVPMFEIAFYSLDSGEYMDSLTFDPTLMGEIKLPAWDEETGAIEMYDFPENSGYTFNKAYYDADGKEEITTATIEHTGSVNLETGTAENPVMPLYVDWTEGEWFHIYTVEQFLDNASVSGCYEIHADLDFTEEIWPSSLMYGNFSGTIIGNGHTLKNIEIIQTNNSKVNAGLFGNLTEEAKISDVTFKNVNFTIQAGTRVAGTSYGLFAGTISADAAIEKVKIQKSTLNVDSDCYFGVDDYSIGVVCGMGDFDVVDKAVIECKAVGNAPETLKVTVDGNTVTVEYVTE